MWASPVLSPEQAAHTAAQHVVLGLFPSEPCCMHCCWWVPCSVSSDTAPAAESPGRSVQGAVLHALNAMQPMCAGSTAALWDVSTGKNWDERPCMGCQQ